MSANNSHAGLTAVCRRAAASGPRAAACDGRAAACGGRAAACGGRAVALVRLVATWVGRPVHPDLGRGRSGSERFWRNGALALAGVMLASSMLAGCGLVKVVKKAEATAHSNTAVIDLFAANLKSGQPTSFGVTYVTTGSAPSKIIYAVRPPNQLAFTDTGTGGAAVNFRFIVNASGEYTCTPSTGGGSGWTCEKLPKTAAAAQKNLLDFYTPAHWVAFLRDFALAAGFAGDKISSSTTTVNGFAMQCVDFVASGVAGTSKICTTTTHLLGYVNVASESTGFEITSYTSSPAPSLFDLPAGAKVTTTKTVGQ
jgi:hypothetical protein